MLQQETVQLLGDQSARVRFQSDDRAAVGDWCNSIQHEAHQVCAEGQSLVVWLTRDTRQSLEEWGDVLLAALQVLDLVPRELEMHDADHALYRSSGILRCLTNSFQSVEIVLLPL